MASGSSVVIRIFLHSALLGLDCLLCGGQGRAAVTSTPSLLSCILSDYRKPSLTMICFSKMLGGLIQRQYRKSKEFRERKESVIEREFITIYCVFTMCQAPCYMISIHCLIVVSQQLPRALLSTLHPTLNR